MVCMYVSAHVHNCGHLLIHTPFFFSKTKKKKKIDLTDEEDIFGPQAASFVVYAYAGCACVCVFVCVPHKVALVFVRCGNVTT